ncbi:TIM barrel protein [Nocardia sp. R7R-8]|uniref:TIM barrel protein n=1 Tax=Nocardia sp. R7R-8 TaxID=3459304 RepID=UPI00403DBBA6
MTEFVMWEASVRTYRYLDQLHATATAGFGGLGLTPAALRAAAEQMGSPAKALAAARNHGIELHLDTVTGWAPIRVPAGADANLRARFDYTLDECLELVDLFELRSMLAVAVFEIGEVEHEVMVRGFRELCSGAEARGVPVYLEFMPFWGVPDIVTAERVLAEAQCANAGLMLDTWHFQRGNPDYEVLERVAATMPVSVQVADGPSEPIGDDLIAETTHHREAPGKGSFPLLDICSAIARTGGADLLGPEVFSDVLDTLTPTAAGQLLGSTTRQLIADLRTSHDRHCL